MEKAYVLINCDLGKEDDVLHPLQNVISVKLHGSLEIIVEETNDDLDVLQEDIPWKIKNLPSLRTITLTEMKN
ncbi:MAG: AsnC family transcriptional regulator [Nitrosopumilus sp.]